MLKMLLRKLPTKERQKVADWAGNIWYTRPDTRRRWLQLYNLEELRHRQPDRFLRKVKAEAFTPISKHGNQLFRSRFMTSWSGGFRFWLRYRDPSTGHVYASGVPQPDYSLLYDLHDAKRADASMAWKFRLTLDEYYSIKQQT